MSQILHLDFRGHRLAYRVSGNGPALVVVHLYRRRLDVVQARMFSDRWQVFEIAPLGYGYSDRVPGYAGEHLAEQILTVLDHHRVDRFVVWGYSAGGAMSLCVARATDRAAGLVIGGFAPYRMTPGIMRQLDRRLRPDHPSRSLWWWYNGFDWPDEVNAISGARLCYWGGNDVQMAKRLRAMREQLMFQDLDFIEFPAFDHRECNSPGALASNVVPAVGTG